MTKRQAVEALDNSMRDIMGRSDVPFGGKAVVFGGDFRQVLPVVRKGSRSQIVDSTLRRSYLWERMRHLRLMRNMRDQSDPWFAEYLLRIGNGTEEADGDGNIRLPDDVCVTYTGKDVDLDKLIDSVFPMLDANLPDPNYITREPSYPNETSAWIKWKQFPIKLSVAMTINKAQGQTIPNVDVHLPQPVFSHGQLYVALSRATARRNIKILTAPDEGSIVGGTPIDMM
ncbi:ATP-dependent DNA helicase PIF1-like [Phragmites australis]|uniref:ATP-dependent DNA helicase PIF1-like n=1 Tax=Phragmites australis TaxID=29695 RepID=UPI002D77165D|nr:ATP-dependent DNA helicase PIF1-like [Phragmites australis]